eukprot:scaffold36842_cov28-Tisochrysis_lutea.AAC.4
MVRLLSVATVDVTTISQAPHSGAIRVRCLRGLASRTSPGASARDGLEFASAWRIDDTPAGRAAQGTCTGLWPLLRKCDFAFGWSERSDVGTIGVGDRQVKEAKPIAFACEETKWM